MSHHRFQCVVVTFIALLVHCCASIAAAKDQPLNVLLLISDDHAWYVAGCYGNTLAKTPNIGRLAEAGMRFDRAYCNSPMCSASRQSLLCGRYPHATGVMLLPDRLRPGERTLAEHLRAHGYRTGAFGKMHFNDKALHGFETHIDMGQWAAAERKNPPEPIPDSIRTLGPWKPFKSPAAEWLNADYLPYPRYDKDMASTFCVRQAIDFITAHRDEPFFVVVGFHEPHSPFRFPVEDVGAFNPADMPVPEPGPEDADQIPLIFRDLTREQKQGIIAAAYTSTMFMDRNVGRVLDAVDKLNLRNNTLIIYVGDNGYHLGQHGRFEKHSFYEGAVRCPMILSLPDRIPATSHTKALAEFVDLFPTVCDLTGVPLPDDVKLHGHSLTPIFRDPQASVRDEVLSEYGHSEEAMLRTDRWKLIYHTGKRARDDGYDDGQPLTGPSVRLYDVQNDPDEFTNLANGPEQRDRVKAMVAELARRLVATESDPEHVPHFATPQAAIDYCLTPIAERPKSSRRP